MRCKDKEIAQKLEKNEGFLSPLECWDKNSQLSRSPIAHNGRTVQRKSWSHQEPIDSAVYATRELPASSL